MLRTQKAAQFFKQNKYILTLAFVGVILIVLTSRLMPAYDWGFPAPHASDPGFFSRLFDHGLTTLISAFPQLYPLTNYLLSGLCHAGSGIFLFLIAKRFLVIPEWSAFLAALIFIVAPVALFSICAPTLLNMTLQMLFGAAGIYFTLSSKTLVKQLIAYLGFSLLAMLTKESGAAFLVIIPLFLLFDCFGVTLPKRKRKAFLKKQLHRLLALYIPGFIVFCVYMLIFFSTMSKKGFIALEGSLTLSAIFRNIFFEFALLVVPYNPQMFTNRPLIIFLILCGAAIALLCLFVLIHLLRKKNKQGYFVLILLAAAMIAVLPFQPAGLAGYYGYLSGFFLCLALGLCIFHIPKAAVYSVVLPYILVCCFSSAIIYNGFAKTTKAERHIFDCVSQDLQQFPQTPSVAVVFANQSKEADENNTQAPSSYLLDGYAFRSFFNYAAKLQFIAFDQQIVETAGYRVINNYHENYAVEGSRE
jgi:hypothetical protein